MKKYKNLFYSLSLMLTVLSSLSLISCSSDDEDEGGSYSSVTTGTWYLVSFDGSSCDWGEYLRFSGKTMYWNNRLGGRNTKYTFTNTSTGFYCTSEDDGDYTFIVSSLSSNRMLTLSDDNMLREWRR